MGHSPNPVPRSWLNFSTPPVRAPLRLRNSPVVTLCFRLIENATESHHRPVFDHRTLVDRWGDRANKHNNTTTMTPNHRNTNKRNAKRKAETPDEEIDEVEVRPQRKKQRQSSSSNHKENSTVAAVTPVSAKPTTSLQKHLVGLYDEITSLMDDGYLLSGLYANG